MKNIIVGNIIGTCMFNKNDLSGWIYFIEDLDNNYVSIKSKFKSKKYKNLNLEFYIYNNENSIDDIYKIGNLFFNNSGIAKFDTNNYEIKLRGINKIIGNLIVIHESDNLEFNKIICGEIEYSRFL